MTRDGLREYFHEELSWGWGHQARAVFDFLCQAAEACRQGVVLDAGAGHQRYRPFFDDCLYIAQEHPEAGAANKGIKEYDILCDARTIPLRDECVDVVLSTVSLEHMEFPQEFVNEAFRVLKPGGSLWIQVPFVYLEHEAPYDFQRPTRYGLMRHFRHAGFGSYWVRPSSSSTEAGIFALKQAIEEDSRRLKRSLHIRIVSKFLRLFTSLYLRAIRRTFEIGPSEDTTLPIGWVSSAVKPGELRPSNRGAATAKEFVAANTRVG